MSPLIMRSKGFAILGMIFILVVLALAGAYMVKMGAGNHAIADLTLIEIRAHYAARSALEIARKEWEQDHVCPNKIIYFKERNTGLNGFEVQLRCGASVNAPSENPHFHALYITAIAKKGQWGERDYVSTQLSQWFTTS